MWKWLTVIGLAATPALIMGQTAAWGAGIGFHLPVVPVGIAIAVAGFLEGMVVVWLAWLAQRIPRLHRWLSKLHAPRFDRWFKRWGVWTGMLVGTAVAGQEPVIIALVWLGAPPKKMVLPLAVANVTYTVVYYLVVVAGLASWDVLMNKLSG